MLKGNRMNPRTITAATASLALIFSCAVESAPKKGNDGQVINLLVDCSHDYSFNLSNANRTQSDIFPGINCLTSCQTIHKLNLEPINALVVLMDGKMPKVEVLAVEAKRLDEFKEGLSPELEEQFDKIVETVRTEIEMENRR